MKGCVMGWGKESEGWCREGEGKEGGRERRRGGDEGLLPSVNIHSV